MLPPSGDRQNLTRINKQVKEYKSTDHNVAIKYIY